MLVCAQPRKCVPRQSLHSAAHACGLSGAQRLRLPLLLPPVVDVSTTRKVHVVRQVPGCGRGCGCWAERMVVVVVVVMMMVKGARVRGA